ncbi:MAG: ATP-binding cassette domain-containing protein [Akkermansiaceae bacterium]
MHGRIIPSFGSGAGESIELPQCPCVAAFRGGSLVLTEPGQALDALPLFRIDWDKRSCTWTATVTDSTARCSRNGKPLSRKPMRLYAGEVVQVEGMGAIEFFREIAPPLLGGNALNNIALPNKKQELVIGRHTPEKVHDSDSCRVDLDKDDFMISKVHCKLYFKEGSWNVDDVSKSGTSLNGRVILGSSRLVFGDRIKISEYLFEFTNGELRRIDHIKSGELEARDLNVIVKDRVTGNPLPILKEVTTRIKPGEFIGILGGSGQGKSTLLDALCGMKPATSGSVTIDGVPNDLLSKVRPGAIGYVPQDDIVHKELTVEQALRYSGRLKLTLKKEELNSLVDKTIDTLGLTDHKTKRIKHLSGGQRKRVSIGIELLTKPSILFLDEPSSGLDLSTEQDLMDLLQSLTINNLTVICTTHVLERAHIFSRLFFIHGGRLIFTGKAQEARDFFLGSDTQSQTQSHSPQSPLTRLYSTVLDGNRTAEEWEQKFHQFRPLPTLGTHDTKQALEKIEKKKQPGPIKKIGILLKRQTSIMMADWMNTTFLVAQVIIIGLLISWVSDDLGLRTFLGLIAAMWFGCSNGAQQIVAELPVFQRERVCGLGLNVYIVSKLLFQGVVSIMQCLLLFSIIVVTSHVFHPIDFDEKQFFHELDERENPYILDNSSDGNSDEFLPMGEGMPGDDDMAEVMLDEEEEEVVPDRNEVKMPKATLFFAKYFHLKENILESGKQGLELDDGSPLMDENDVQKTSRGIGIAEVIGKSLTFRLGSFILITIVGVSLGLMVSALVRSSTQAVMWVPLILIPQILFGGFVIKLPDMSATVRKLSSVFPSNAAQQLVDVSHIYGRMMPTLSNRTETPLFLTSNGEEEIIEWEEKGEEQSQSYDKVSDVNPSWQNLTIRHPKLGQHKQHHEVIYGTRTRIPTDTVMKRRDVKYSKGTNFLFTQPAYNAAMILGGWALFCYLTIVIALWKKKIS